MNHFLKLLVPLIFSTSAIAGSYHAYLTKLLNKKEAQIDIAEIALDMAQEVTPKMDRKAYEKKLDDMALKIFALSSQLEPSPMNRVRGINTYLLKIAGIEFDNKEDSLEVNEYHLLPRILDTKKGSIVTMSLLYIILGQKLNYPIYYVRVPGHAFLKYHAPPLKDFNIETTAPKSPKDEDYIRLFSIPKKAIAEGIYLSPVSRKEYVADLLSINAAIWFSRGEVKRGVDYIEAAAKLAASSPSILATAGDLLDLYAKLHRDGGNPRALRHIPKLEKRGKYFHELSEKLQAGEVPPELKKTSDIASIM